MRKLIALTTVLALTVLTACGGSTQNASTTNNNTKITEASKNNNTSNNTKTTEPSKSSEYSYTYVDVGGSEYSGTYTGEWENNCPNGEGSFDSKGDFGKLSLVGSWSNGQPNGQCIYTLETNAGIYTYNGDFFHGVKQGNGNIRIEDLSGNLLVTYSGEFRDDEFNGDGEYTHYFSEEETKGHGIVREVYKGQFSNSAMNGAGEHVFYMSNEFVAEYGYDRLALTGQFIDNVMDGEGSQTLYYTKEFATEFGVDRLVCTGQFADNEIKEPYRYSFYSGNEAVEEGRVRDGNLISDGEKAITDGLYDAGRKLAGDGIGGFLYDAIASSFYDRDAY